MPLSPRTPPALSYTAAMQFPHPEMPSLQSVSSRLDIEHLRSNGSLSQPVANHKHNGSPWLHQGFLPFALKPLYRSFYFFLQTMRFAQTPHLENLANPLIPLPFHDKSFLSCSLPHSAKEFHCLHDAAASPLSPYLFPAFLFSVVLVKVMGE